MKETLRQLHHFPATTVAQATQPPLLFVHGAYTNAQCWQQHFIPWFQARGYTCYALDLPGHGDNPVPDLDRLGLDDYAAELARAVAVLPEPPVLIGHSMGCLVVQGYLTRGTARAAALLAPVPPTGTGGSAARLALTCPDFFSELPRATTGTGDAHTIEVMAGIYFSPDMPPQDIEQYLPMIQPESERAVLEMVNLAFRPAGHRPRLPVLTMSGGEDRVFPPSMLGFTTVLWNARSCVVPRAGHMLMFDPQWPDAAGALLQWLESI